MDNTPEIFTALKPIVDLFTMLEVPYYIGGSVASSAYGVSRSTLDVDMVADIPRPLIDTIVKNLKGAYYIDKDMMIEAVRDRSCFNIIHLETMFKIDVFIVKNREYDRQSLARRKQESWESEKEPVELFFASPEDVVLNKLEWFRQGGEVSERQWGDLLGVIKVQCTFLDQPYLRNWAVRLGVEDLLMKAWKESES